MPPTRLAFHHLSFVPEGDAVMVGRMDTDSYALFPPDGAEFLRRLVGGEPIDDAAAWYERAYGEPLDVADFLATVDDLGFTSTRGELPTGALPLQRAWVAPLARMTFSRAAWACYALLLAAAVTAMVEHPWARPQRANVFYVHSFALVEFTFIVGQLPGLLLHEGFHVLAGRRLGLPARLTVTVRLYFVVFESHLMGILGCPRRQRYLPYLAGIVADLLWFCTLTVLGAVLVPIGGAPGVVGRLALALAFPTVFRLMWQLWVVMRTDLYHVVGTALGCVDLHAAASARLRNAWWRTLRKPDRTTDLAQWSGRDAELSCWYAPLALAMTVFLVGVAARMMVSVVWTFATSSAHALHGAHGFDAGTVDSLVGLALVVVPFLVAVALWLRKLGRLR